MRAEIANLQKRIQALNKKLWEVGRFLILNLWMILSTVAHFFIFDPGGLEQWFIVFLSSILWNTFGWLFESAVIKYVLPRLSRIKLPSTTPNWVKNYRLRITIMSTQTQETYTSMSQKEKFHSETKSMEAWRSSCQLQTCRQDFQERAATNQKSFAESIGSSTCLRATYSPSQSLSGPRLSQRLPNLDRCPSTFSRHMRSVESFRRTTTSVGSATYQHCCRFKPSWRAVVNFL
jgi:hypothetical protein